MRYLLPPGAGRRAGLFVGRWAVILGVLAGGFGVWQTWGTGLLTGRSQQRLEGQFDAARRSAPELSRALGLPAPDDAATPASEEQVAAGSWLRVADDGSAAYLVAPFSFPVARLSVPSAGLAKIVVLGDRRQDLRHGPGMAVTRVAPGSLTGNTVIPGHRTTYGAPFADLDKVEVGDDIRVETVYGTFDYRVRLAEIVPATDRRLMAETSAHQLTLYTCHPRFSSRQRILVIADPVSPIATMPVLLEVGEPRAGTTAALPSTEAGDEPVREAAASPAAPAGSAAEEREEILAAERGWSRDPLLWVWVAGWFALFAVLRRVVVRLWTGDLLTFRDPRLRRALTVPAALCMLAAVIAMYEALGKVVPAGV